MLPVARLNRSFGMGHAYLPCALVEPREVGQARLANATLARRDARLGHGGRHGLLWSA